MIYFCLPSPDSLPSQDRQNDVVLLASKWDFDIMAGKPYFIFTSCGMTLGARSAKKGCAQIHPWKPTCEKSLSNYKGSNSTTFSRAFSGGSFCGDCYWEGGRSNIKTSNHFPPSMYSLNGSFKCSGRNFSKTSTSSFVH